MKFTIKHVWFDFSETIASIKKNVHDRLKYAVYAEVAGKKLTPELHTEYDNLYEKFHHSNSALFHSLGLPAGFWSGRLNSVSPNELYELADTSIPEILKQLKSIVPISIFSNIDLAGVLPSLGLPMDLFAHVISSSMFKNPKPALDGFYKIIELSELPPNEILYIGDTISKDILPAKKVGLVTGLMWDKSDEADYCFETFKDILNIFNRS